MQAETEPPPLRSPRPRNGPPRSAWYQPTRRSGSASAPSLIGALERDAVPGPIPHRALATDASTSYDVVGTRRAAQRARWITTAKNCCYAWKNPEDLTDRQTRQARLDRRDNHQLYRAYLLKEQLRLVFHSRGDDAVAMLDAWLHGPCTPDPAPVKLYHRIKKHRAHRRQRHPRPLHLGLTESYLPPTRLLTRIAYGFRSTDKPPPCLPDRGGHAHPPRPKPTHGRSRRAEKRPQQPHPQDTRASRSRRRLGGWRIHTADIEQHPHRYIAGASGPAGAGQGQEHGRELDLGIRASRPSRPWTPP